MYSKIWTALYDLLSSQNRFSKHWDEFNVYWATLLETEIWTMQQLRFVACDSPLELKFDQIFWEGGGVIG